VIERLLSLGFETRIELRLEDGQRAWAQLTAAEARRLGLELGQRVGVDLSQGRTIGWHLLGKPAAPPTPLPVLSREVPPIARDA
jgi:hypothetical protein